MEHVRTMGAELVARLEVTVAKYPKLLKGVRGRGLMIGLMCQDDTKPLVLKLRENRLLSVGAANNVIRLLPPLIIEDHHIDEAMTIIDSSCAQLSGRA
jgi:acetylornithine/N-succinyldiaminopimelate aminotransferase